MSWDLNVAEAREIYLTEEDCWRYTQQFLMHAHYTTTYKFILMKALLESIIEISDSGRLQFIQVTKHVTKIYFNLSITLKLQQLNSKEKTSSIDKVMKEFQMKYQIPDNWHFDKIPESQQNELIKQVDTVYKKYVYGSFYTSFGGTIYSFNKKEGWLQLAPQYIVFFEKYKRILITLTNFYLAKFLEKYNTKEAIQSLLNKVEFASVRQSLLEFQILLQKYGEHQCFYCKKTIKKPHVDHFIPWSFVQNDVLWNFVLACPSCNSSKNDKLAHSTFLEKLVERNNSWRTYEEMSTYSESKLIHMYDYAKLNGYVADWMPKTP